MDQPCRRVFRILPAPGRPLLLAALLLATLPGCQSRRGPEETPGEAVARAGADVGAGEATAQEPTLDQALRLADAADPNGALNILDALPEAARAEAGYWRLFGRCSLQLAREERSRRPANVPFLLDDAARGFREAAARAPEDGEAWLGLADALLEAGDPQGAWEAAARWREIVSQPEPAGLLLAGRAGLALTVAAVQNGQAVPAAARPAEAALRAALAAGAHEAVVPLSDLLAWRGLVVEARQVLVEALLGDPGNQEWIQRLKNLDSGDPAAYVSDLEQVRAAAPGDPTLLWYAGEAHYLHHSAARARGDFITAYEALDRAETAFLESMARNADFEESCRQWLHLVRTARGWTLREEGRSQDAAEAFVAALEADPERLEATPDPGSLTLGIYAVVDDFFRSGRLEDAVATLRRVCALKDDNPDWLNNYGFACRDLGVARQRAGRGEEAQALFEEAWQAYGRCVEISPEDPRLVNDRALIAVYYLDHDWDLAESELQRAIALGRRMLDGLPADVTEEKRQRLEEAVGDAWENLAYLDVMRRRRVDRAEGYLAESVRYFPYDRREGVLRLRAELKRLQSGAAGGGGGS